MATRRNVRIHFGKLSRKFKSGRTSRRREENFKIVLRHMRGRGQMFSDS
jgi:hypothetical protein